MYTSTKAVVNGWSCTAGREVSKMGVPELLRITNLAASRTR
jgi:hypothetical protein